MAMSNRLVVPDRVGAEVGWRAWAIETRGDEILLSSVTRAEVWPARERMEASCRIGHEPPAKSCGCGLYAASTLEHLQGMDYHRHEAVIGQVALWGRVIAGTLGWRAQFGYPERLLVPYGLWRLAVPLRDAYGVQVQLANVFAEGGEPSGHRH